MLYRPGSTYRTIFIRCAAALSAGIGILVLVGWGYDLPYLRSVLPGAVEMKANTAIGLIGCAVALMLSVSARASVPGSLAAMTAAAFVAVLGAATLSQYAFALQLGIDELIVKDTGAAFNQIKGRMSPYSAAAFILFGLAIAFVVRPRLANIGRFCGALVVAIGVVSIVGYLWNASEIVTDRMAPPVALNTALAFVMLGAAVMLSYAPALPESARQRARTRLERLLIGSFVPTAMLVMIGGGLTYESGASFARAAERVSHTQEVRAELGGLRAAMGDAETSMRNLMLTRNEDFDKSFVLQAAEARSKIDKLRALVSDNPAQGRLLQSAGTIVEAQVGALKRIGDVYRDQGRDSARESLAAQVRDGNLARLDELIGQMDTAEGTLLSARLQQSDHRRGTTLALLLATLAALTGLFAVLFRGIRTEMSARGRAEDELQRLNTELEVRIAERTNELSHQQAFLRRVIDLDRNLVFAKSLDGRFVLANQAVADFMGTTVDALIGQTERQFIQDAAAIDEFEAADRRVIESGTELSLPQESVVSADGQRHWLATVKRPILSPDGQSTIVLGVAVDITQRIAAEEEIRELNVDLEARVAERTRDLAQANVLLEQARLDSEAASRAKSAFLANMSHEIRTPMNAIIGLTHLMLRETADRAQRDRLGKVSEAAQHLLQVINDILDMSKIEAGKMTLESIEFSLDEVLSSATAMVKAQATSKGLELVLDSDALPDRLVGDPTRLSQILINLLSNAVKFTDHGWIRLRGERMGEDGRRLQIRFEVQDTGPGIPVERQAGLFNAFEQADTSTSRQHGGTGLGLALCLQLARAMGGDAGLTSAPGAGSVFWFSAWLTRAAPAPARLVPIRTVGLRALLVDDLPEALSVIGDLLRNLGLSVDEFASGPEAGRRVEVEIAAGRPYDVLVIDWRMEPWDGIETLRRLRGLLGEGTPAAVLVTAFDDASLATRAREAGYQAVIVKPVTQSSLQDALAVALSRTRVENDPLPVRNDGEFLLRAQHGGQRVLLVEDNPVNLEVAEELLRSAGLVVDAAGDGARAVEMALSRHYDLILMDVQMPIMDGLEASSEIRARSGHTTPIIAMTANAFAEDRAASLAVGMNDHVAKPVDPAVLYATLLRWLPMRPTPAAEGPTSDFGSLTEVDLKSRMASVAEIDFDAALRHVAGQHQVLARVLARFLTTYKDGLPALLDTTGDEAEQATRWRAVCHSVRGALGIIAASSLIEQVTELEKALGGTPKMPPLYAEGAKLHQGVLQLVEHLRTELR